MRLTVKDIERFLTTMEFAETTQRDRRYVLRAFSKWLGDGDFDEDSVREYASQQYKKPSTYNTTIGIMKSLAGWMMKRLPRDDLGAYIRNRQVLELIRDIRLKKVVTVLERKEFYMEELQKIFSLLEGVAFSGLWCLAWFGCRPGELVGLRLEHINTQPDKYLPPRLAKELRPDDYCVKFLTEKTKVQRALFMDTFTMEHLVRFIESGRGISFLQKTCRGLREKIDFKFTPRMFRSNFDTKMQRILNASKAEAPTVIIELLVKVMAGHTVHHDITPVYTDYGADIKRAMTDLHFMKPLEGKKRNSLDESNYRKIIEYVAGAPGATTKDVSQALNLSRPNATRGLSQMEGLGYLHAEKRVKGRGRPPSEYYLTQDGREKLRSIVGAET